MEMIGAFDPALLASLLTPDSIKDKVATALHVRRNLIDSNDRGQHVALARMIAMYLIRTSTTFTFPEIGELFGRDHSTVIHACNKIADRMTAEPQFREFVDAILQPRDG